MTHYMINWTIEVRDLPSSQWVGISGGRVRREQKAVTGIGHITTIHRPNLETTIVYTLRMMDGGQAVVKHGSEHIVKVLDDTGSEVHY